VFLTDLAMLSMSWSNDSHNLLVLQHQLQHQLQHFTLPMLLSRHDNALFSVFQVPFIFNPAASNATGS
jgi:hypothetical protein